MLEVESPYAAYCLDTAVGEFGRALDAELKAVEGKTKKELLMKTQRVLAKWLDEPLQYRDPVKAGVAPMPTRSEG